jgi:hypothetical protein
MAAHGGDGGRRRRFIQGRRADQIGEWVREIADAAQDTGEAEAGQAPRDLCVKERTQLQGV